MTHVLWVAVVCSALLVPLLLVAMWLATGMYDERQWRSDQAQQGLEGAEFRGRVRPQPLHQVIGVDMSDIGQRGNEGDMLGGDGEARPCPVCDQTFPSQEELSKHLMLEHADEETFGDPREGEDPIANMRIAGSFIARTPGG